MTDGTDVITQAVVAARAEDLDALGRLVDWPLTGAAQVASSLSGVDERDRAAGAASGLAELTAAAGRPDLVAEILRPVAAGLAGAREVRPAGPQERAAALAALQVPAVPAGLTEQQVAALDELRARAAALTEVYVVMGVAADVPVARAADTGLLVLLLD
jgi:hypothetical protein